MRGLGRWGGGGGVGGVMRDGGGGGGGSFLLRKLFGLNYTVLTSM